jgi:hypothetical protein
MRGAERTVPVSLSDFASSGKVGRPVLAVVDSEARWTLLGTHAVASLEAGATTVLELDAIRDCSSDLNVPKGKDDHLRLRDREGVVHLVWAHPGPTFSGLWSILLMLTRMQGPSSRPSA